MQNFIYVFNDEAKNILLSQGYSLLKSDSKKSIYIFQNKEQLHFNLDKGSFVLSNILTF